MNLHRLWQRTVGGFPADFWVLWSGILVNRIGGLAFPFLSFFLISRGVPQNVAAAAVSCWGIGGLSAAFFGGWCADRIGRKFTLLTGLGTSVVVMFAIPWCQPLFLIYACAFLAGFAFDFQRPAVSAAVADLVPVSERVRAYALNYWAINIGASIAPLIGGVLATFSFHFLFSFDGTTALLYFAIILFWFREPRQHKHIQGTRRSPFAAFRDHRLLLLFGLACLLTGQFFQAYSTLPLVMSQKGLDAGDFSRALVTNGVTVVLLSIPISRFLQRWSPATGLSIAAICTGTGFFLTQFARTTPEYAATIFIWSLGEIAIASTTPALISRIAPPGQQGVYQGSYSMSWSFGILLGPAAGGFVLQTFGEHALWSGCGILGFLAAIGFWFLLGRTEVAGEQISNPETDPEAVLEAE
ncbi:MAG: MFS transporter [Verrucomicrobia bacterium]|nr:MFS transporter [Verrucomicrobiota bacterium]